MAPALGSEREVREAGLLTLHEASGVRRDWHALEERNADTVAWVSVAGTSIDTPVLRQPSDAADGWYLAHGFDGQRSDLGCPYLDAHADANASLRVVFGHHVTLTHLAFSDLGDAWQQERFDALGACVWETPRRTLALKPLCALLIMQDDEQMRLARDGDLSSLGAWVAKACERARARSPDWKAQLARLEEVVALVTCASVLPGQDARSVVLFSA